MIDLESRTFHLLLECSTTELLVLKDQSIFGVDVTYF